MEIIPILTYEEVNRPDFVLPWGIKTLAAQVEHVIDQQIMLEFFLDITLRRLKSGLLAALGAVDGECFRFRQETDPVDFEEGIFHKLNAGLGAEPALNPGGAQSDSPARRTMEPFGTNKNPLPFLYCDPMINGAKGRIMRGKASSDLAVITTAARTAATTDTPAAYANLMHHFRLAQATWEYMRAPEFAIQFNVVRQGVHSQLSLVEKHTEIPDIVGWWDP